MHYGDAVPAAQAKATKAEEGKKATEAQLTVAQAEVERLKKELYEHHKLTTNAVEASNREKAELRQQIEAQSEEIASLKEELKSAGEEVHPTLDISPLEVEFGGPTGGRPNKVVEEAPEAQEAASAEVPPTN
ncbi:uncharacterized protein C16A3.08c-like [Olea europaea var. sylvestris]|uniref:uncharacterized protein C16A3.08c-like n=1 Tax=Olea europaea var. sylvestris TaxID=158386 RepID=UPI000C1CF53C|nr:uncharacterized protein C16A3.08c-like [Olea europaea var. sylvestris]